MKSGNDLLSQLPRKGDKHNAAAQSAAPAANQSRPKLSGEQISAINQLFAELELAYHNQFHKAFPGDKLQVAKQLWAHSLADLSAEQIMRGCRTAIQESAYLPTLHTIREHSQFKAEDLGLPNVHSAYLEACRAPSPKSDFDWSHPAVYYAGQASDWFFLANSTENKAFPVFKRHYELLCERVQKGEDLETPVPPALPETISKPLSASENKSRLAALKRELKL